MLYSYSSIYLLKSNIKSSFQIQIKRDIKGLRHQVLEEIWTNITESNVLIEEEWSQSIQERLKEFEADIIKAIKVKGWNGHEDESQIQWTFANSLFYSIVCITSIGYGDQAPKTQLGKIVTVLYVIIGFPLMIICVNNTGAVMAEGFRFIYWRICCIGNVQFCTLDGVDNLNQNICHRKVTAVSPFCDEL